MIMITFLSTKNHIYEQNNSNMKQFLHKTYSTAKLETFGWKQEKNMTEFCFCSLHVDTTLRIINLFNIFNFFNIPDPKSHIIVLPTQSSVTYLQIDPTPGKYFSARIQHLTWTCNTGMSPSYGQWNNLQWYLHWVHHTGYWASNHLENLMIITKEALLPCQNPMSSPQRIPVYLMPPCFH